MDQFYLLITTCPNLESANQMAHSAVDQKLAACVQVQAPCVSHYHWNDAVQTATEYPVHFKTEAKHLEALKNMIVQMHDYDVPEVIALPIDYGDEAYLSWCREVLK